jgi:hypothetical protein
VDQERYAQPLLVDGVVVLLEVVVLAEALAVVAEDHEDRVLVQTQLLVLVEEVLQKVVLVADGVQVLVQRLVFRELLFAVAVGNHVVVVGRDGEVGGQERAVVAVLLEPGAARFEHYVVLVAEVVGLLEALLVHPFGGGKGVVAEVLHELRAPLERSSSPTGRTCSGSPALSGGRGDTWRGVSPARTPSCPCRAAARPADGRHERLDVCGTTA